MRSVVLSARWGAVPECGGFCDLNMFTRPLRSSDVCVCSTRQRQRNASVCVVHMFLTHMQARRQAYAQNVIVAACG